jgi:hypothetical protein
MTGFRNKKGGGCHLISSFLWVKERDTFFRYVGRMTLVLCDMEIEKEVPFLEIKEHSTDPAIISKK